MLNIYIHSSGRAGSQPTLKALMETRYAPNVWLVVQEKEAEAYYKAHPDANIRILPADITMLSPTRQHLLYNTPADKIILMDDDLTFSGRSGQPMEVRLLPLGAEGLENMIAEVEGHLNDWTHVGISAREGNNRVSEYTQEVGRMMRVLAYDVEVVTKIGARFDRIDTKQDFDMTLQLLRAGHPNLIMFNYAHNQPGSQKEGGCAAYRDEEMMARCSYELANLHPGFVKVVAKETKSSWGGGIRTDVRISWKKAYEDSTRT